MPIDDIPEIFVDAMKLYLRKSCTIFFVESCKLAKHDLFVQYYNYKATMIAKLQQQSCVSQIREACLRKKSPKKMLKLLKMQKKLDKHDLGINIAL